MISFISNPIIIAFLILYTRIVHLLGSIHTPQQAIAVYFLFAYDFNFLYEQ